MATFLGKTFWLTGLPCSGKTTIGKKVANKIGAELLDGDTIRNSYISKGLGFSFEDRRKHLLRIAEICKLLNRHTDVVACFVSPYNSIRKEVRQIIGENRFKLIYLKCSIDVCIDRDVKGMWSKALRGEIDNFTGIQSPFEEPLKCDLILETDKESIKQSVDKVLEFYDKLKPKEKYCVFIGRWSPFHKGHYNIIKRKLDKGKSALILVRDTSYKDDIWTANERKAMIEAVLPKEKVKVDIIPDIESVIIGRNVGYDIEEMIVEDEVAKISGTFIRKNYLAGDNRWEKLVPKKVVDFLKGKKG